MKQILLTGGSRGIGEATAKLLRSQGYRVITPNRGELDLNSIESVETFIKANRHLKLYALINNAGVNNPQWIEEIENKIAHIINVGSMFGVISRAKQSVYTASKFGIIGLTKALALELAKYNILVNSISPGFVVTDLTLRNTPEKNAQLAKEVPLTRFAKPLEIAQLISFLISEKNTYITGEN